MTTEKINFHRFNPIRVGKNSQTMIIGKRGSGKSWLIRDLIKKNQSAFDLCVFSPTEKHSNFYGRNFPAATIKFEYSPEDIQELLNEQAECISRGSPRNLCVVLDDCLSSKGTWLKDDSLRELMLNGRHYNIALYLTMQFPLGMTPELRSTFDTVYLLADDFISNQKRLYDHYAGMFPTFDSFRKTFLDLARDYSAMVIRQKGCWTHILDRVLWYRAEAEDHPVITNQLDSDYDSDEDLISTIDARIQSRLSNMGCMGHLSLAAGSLFESLSNYLNRE